MDDLTPWEDINPPMASARRLEPQQPSLAPDLQPAAREQFALELTACLALVAPVGMTEESRREWLAVAWETVKHLPPDMLAHGCKMAREKCDHPSKIVPAIIAETEDWLKLRRSNRSTFAALPSPEMRPKKPLLERRGESMTEAETEELNGLLEGLGATARYRPDGSRYMVERPNI